MGFLEYPPSSSSWRLVKEDGPLPLLCSTDRFLHRGRWRSPSEQGELTAKGAVRTAGGGRGGAPAVREEKAALLHVHRFRKGLQGLLGFFFPFSVMPAGESVPQARQDT